MNKEMKAIGVLPATGSIRVSWQPPYYPDLPGPKPSREEHVYPILGFVVYERER